MNDSEDFSVVAKGLRFYGFLIFIVTFWVGIFFLLPYPQKVRIIIELGLNGEYWYAIYFALVGVLAAIALFALAEILMLLVKIERNTRFSAENSRPR